MPEYTYSSGGFQSRVGPTSVGSMGGALAPSTGPGGGGGSDFFATLARAAVQRQEEEKARRRALEDADERRRNEAHQLAMQRERQDMENAAQREGLARALTTGAGQEPEEGDPYYVKTVSGFNMGGGYRPAQAWEPGAIVAGRLPRGVRAPQPQAAGFGGVVQGQSGAALEPPPPPKPPTLEERLSALGANPWATGPGVVGGRYVGR